MLLRDDLTGLLLVLLRDLIGLMLSSFLDDFPDEVFGGLRLWLS